MKVDEDPFLPVQEVSINMNSVVIEALIEEREKVHQHEHAKNLGAQAKKSLKSQDFDPKFSQSLCIGCGKKYVEICKERKFENKGNKYKV